MGKDYIFLEFACLFVLFAMIFAPGKKVPIFLLSVGFLIVGRVVMAILDAREARTRKDDRGDPDRKV